MLLKRVLSCRAAKQNERAKNACCHLGLVVVNALSQWLRMRVFCGGDCWVQEYREGIAEAPFRREAKTDRTGIEISFRPDGDLLGRMEFDALALAAWLPKTGLCFESLEYRPGDTETQALSMCFAGLRPCGGARPANPPVPSSGG